MTAGEIGNDKRLTESYLEAKRSRCNQQSKVKQNKKKHNLKFFLWEIEQFKRNISISLETKLLIGTQIHVHYA